MELCPVLTLRPPLQAAAEREAAGAGRTRQQRRRDDPPPAHGGNVGHAEEVCVASAHRARPSASLPPL